MSVLCAGKPESYFVVPDPYTPEVASVSSQAGVYPGLTTSTTPGRLVPMQSGETLATGIGTTYQYGLVRSGGTGTAEYVWSRNSGIPVGKDDIRNWWGFHSPSTSLANGRNNSVLFHAPTRNIYIFGALGNSTNVYVESRNVDTDRFDVFTTAYSITLRQATHVSDYSGIGTTALYDGTCIMVVRNNLANDFDVYSCPDPSTNTWTLASRNILSRFLGSTYTQGTKSQIRVASSGDFIRLSFALPSSGGATPTCTVKTVVSSDRGATWTGLADISLSANASTTDDYCAFDICGAGESGTFILVSWFPPVSLPVPYGQRLLTFSGWGSGDWSSPIFSTKTMTQDIRSIAVASSASEVYVFALWSDAGTAANDGWMIAHLDVAEIASGGLSWQFLGATTSNTYDGLDFLPCRLKCVWCGNGWYFYGVTKTEVSGTGQTDGYGWYFGTWTQRSLGTFGPSQDLTSMTTPMWSLAWYYNGGKPVDGAGTAWTRTSVGTAGDSITTEGMLITTQTVGAARYYQHAGMATSGTWYTSGGIWSCQFRLNTGDGTSATHGINIRMADAAGVYYYQVTVKFRATQIVVTDGVSGSDVATISGLTIDTSYGGAYHIIRMSVAGSGAGFRVEALDTATGIWHTSSPVNLTRSTAGSLYTSFVQFGVLIQGVAAIEQSWWRDFACTTNGTLLNRQSANMTDPTLSTSSNLLFGDSCFPTPQYLEYGLYVSWSGLSGRESDLWSGTMAYTNPGESVLVDSPRIAWRTTDITAAQIVLYIGSAVNRFSHNAIAIFGCNNRQVLVDYDVSASFLSPTTAQVVDMTAYGTGATPLVIAQTSGTSMQISGTTFKFTAGELVGQYVRIVSSSTPGAIGLTFKITRHPVVNRIYFDEEVANLIDQGISTADTFLIFSPSGVKRYASLVTNYDYMRIRLADTNTAEGYHQLGTIVTGISIDVDVPLDWAHTDDDQPNVTSYRTKSGIAWAFAEGPTQRTYTGRVVGDAERWREKFRNMFRQISYEGKACALVLNADQTPESLMLGRVKSGASLDNAGWYRDSNGIMRTAGDLSLTFVEEK